MFLLGIEASGAADFLRLEIAPNGTASSPLADRTMSAAAEALTQHAGFDPFAAKHDFGPVGATRH
jgi:hypothetical protein